MDAKTNTQLKEQQRKQLINDVLPIYLVKELKITKKPITMIERLSIPKLNKYIQKRFPDAGENLITEDKLNNIYEGIVDKISNKIESAMIFKNIAISDIIQAFYVPYDLKEVMIIRLSSSLNIIIVLFKNQDQSA